MVTLMKEYKGKYVIHKYDCSNMSFDLCLELIKRGYDARIYGYIYGHNGHAIVEVYHNGKLYYIDPARQWAFIRKPKNAPLVILVPTQIGVDYTKEFIGHLVK